jgi:hypothetical protein
MNKKQIFYISLSSNMSTQIQISQILSSEIISENKVLNPETKRYIKINGRLFNALVPSKFSYDSDNQVLIPSKDYVPSSVVFVVNPLTKRKIKVGSKNFEELLINSCVYDKDTNTLTLVDGKVVVDKSDDDKAINPLTNRKITIGGKLFESLLLTHTFNKDNKTFSKLEEESSVEVIINENIAPTTDAIKKPYSRKNITCTRCKLTGHYATTCNVKL